MKRKVKKFNYSILAVIIMLSACSKEGDPGPQGPKGDPGESTVGPAGEDGNTTSFYFQQGFKGYEGTRDVTICSDPLSESFNPLTPPPTPEGKYLYVAREEFTGEPTDSATTLLRFGDMAEIVEEIHGESICSDEFFINEAILYLSGLSVTDEGSLLQIGIFGENAPTFDEMAATWDMANADETWNGPGGEEQWAFEDPLVSTAIPDANIGYLQSFQSTSGGDLIYHQPYFIPRETVRKWLCEGGNKGFRLAPYSENKVFYAIYSSEHPNQELRPLLYINIDKGDSNTRKRVLSPEEARAVWQQKSYKEKMAPLYRLYPSLRANQRN